MRRYSEGMVEAVLALIYPGVEVISPQRMNSGTNLELGVALVEQDVNNGDLADIAVLLELLADLGADGGYGHAERVHGLDLGGLYWVYHVSSSTPQLNHPI
jgi:hypothetical protein